MARSPWTNLGLYRNVDVTVEWEAHEAEFTATADCDDARIHFDVGSSDVSVELSAVTLRDHAADRSVPLLASVSRLRRARLECPLAIFTPSIGARSETFIRRHVRDLVPGRTAILTYEPSTGPASDWEAIGPVFDLGSSSDRALEEFLQAHGVRVLMGEYLDESLRLLEPALDLSIRFFAHAHGYDVSAVLRDPDWAARYRRYDRADGVVTINEPSRIRLIDIGLPPDKVHLVPYGVDVPTEPGCRAPGPYVRCLAVGRMVPKKAPLLTLDAFALAAERYPELRLDFVGDGPLFDDAARFVDTMRLSAKVTLHGSMPNRSVLQMMEAADIFMQHSMTDPSTGDEEGLPVAILEAMSRSLPVVSTRHAGIPEAVVDRATGLLSSEGDAKAMAEHIRYLCLDPVIRQAMGRRGWAWAHERFSWERERRTLLELFGLECADAVW